MADKTLMLRGDNIRLQSVSDESITDEYVNWLNDKEVVRFSNQRFMQHSKESCLAYLQSFQGTDNIFLSINEIKNDRAIGSITAYLNIHHGTADMGLLIGDRSVWGNGYGLEAWQLLMGYLFNDAKIRKVTGGTVRDNIAMIKIMERSGMHLEAIRKKQELISGVAIDVLHFAKFLDV